jgi:hypothetical protein
MYITPPKVGNGMEAHGVLTALERVLRQVKKVLLKCITKPLLGFVQAQNNGPKSTLSKVHK